MEFLVAVGDFALGVDPEEAVAHTFGVCVARFVDADRNGNAVLLGFLANTLEEGGLVCGFAEGVRFIRVGPDVVASLREEECLAECIK